MKSNRRAFTLIEIVISVALLFSAMILINAAGGTLHRIEKVRQSTALYLEGTPMATADVRLLHREEMPLNRRIYFPKLRDDEIFMLKDIRLKLKLSEPKQKELYHTLRYSVQTLRIGDLKGNFIRVIRMHP